MGFSPFSIVSTDSPADETIAHSYRLLQQVLPEAMKQDRPQVEGVWLTKDEPEMAFTLGDYRFVAKHHYTLLWIMCCHRACRCASFS